MVEVHSSPLKVLSYRVCQKAQRHGRSSETGWIYNALGSRFKMSGQPQTIKKLGIWENKILIFT